MKRILIIGSGGAGKSTLARQLGERLHLDVYHLDALMWRPGWVMAPREERIDIQQQLVKKDQWIIDGNFGNTLDLRLQAADTVILIDLPRLVCVYRVLKRVVRYRGTTRPDMGASCEEKLDFAFLKWVWNFPDVQRPQLLRQIQQHPKQPNLVHLKSSQAVKQFVDSL
ncbi:DNA topology modulation protein [Exiguobacterium sp. B2(2022)]|uniref:DNA topology modulation protein n=1 Tax=Exiguobacterium sp. B2(2022) TaxID=2992755 RepID=UPI00237A53B3|nr:DNA topology modulation protein [Exiguobacterium sp. B2(2022)]MDE0563291.1 DNA topology modulation protein [Exiguobacterium sp. B2(2022)]